MKGKATCNEFVSVSFNGISKLLGHSKFGGLTGFRNVNHAGVDTILVTGNHLRCPVERVYTGFTHVKLKKDSISRDNQWGKGIRNFKVFGLLRGC